VFSSMTNKFTNKPSLYYSMSIAATWAGVGSLVVGMQMVREFGIIPFLIWALGNILACIVFGIFAPTVPKLKEVFQSKPMYFIIGIICVFQVWLSMNGIQYAFSDTLLSGTFGVITAYAVTIFFIFLFIKFGMIRNVLTDNASWTIVYGLIAILTIAAIIYSRGNMNPLVLGLDNICAGAEKGLLLLPGAFLYPYFYEILNYNEKNEDGTKRVDARKAFIDGGLLFGVYLIFVFLLAWANFGLLLNTIKAFLITLVAVSTISSFLYSIYITYGKKAGILVNIGCVALWQFLIPLGVLGVWTLMSSIRIFIVAGGILYAIAWNFLEKRKAVRA